MGINLVGTYTHTLDPKRRVSLPAKLRPQLGSSVMVTRGLQQNLAIYPMEEWARFTQRVDALPMSESTRNFRRLMFSNAAEAEIDTAGRILVPEMLCQWAQLKEKVAFIGVKDLLELWDESLWNKYNSDMLSGSDSLVEKIDELWQEK